MTISESPKIDLLNIDCMEYMAGVPDKFFDLAIVDPEYRDENQPKKEMRNKIGGKMNWYGKPTKEYFEHLFRVSKNQIIWGANNFIENLYSTNCFLFWYKKNPMDNYSDGEFAWTSFNKVSRCINIPHFGAHTSDKTKIHPTQKPVKLYRWLLENYATCKKCHNSGTIYEDVCGDGGSRMAVDCEYCDCAEHGRPKILDTHGGSMSSAIACHQMGFDLTLCELDKDYYEAGVKRFREQTMQQSLFKQ